MGHEWNEVQIGGAWYEVDVTWDTSAADPYGEGNPSSEEDHTYFLISDEIMSYDHYGQSLFYDCDTMASNYYIMAGYADTWAEMMAETVTAAFVPDEETEVSLTDELAYDYAILPDRTWYRQDIVAADVAELLTGTRIVTEDALTYQLTVTHVPSGWDDASDALLVSGQWVPPILRIPDSVTAIGARAFAGSGSLQAVQIGSGVTSIAEDAFEGCSESLVFLVDDADSYAAAWAVEHGFSVRVIKDE